MFLDVFIVVVFIMVIIIIVVALFLDRSFWMGRDTLWSRHGILVIWIMELC